MQKHQFNFRYALISCVMAIAILSLFSSQVFSQELIEYSYQIKPRELSDPQVNFPYQDAQWVGDLNNDGNDDLVFTYKVGDERTPELEDKVSKSFIFYETDPLGSNELFHDKALKYVGDFNGDGIDDAYDIENNFLHYGQSGGIGEQGVTFQTTITGIIDAFPIGDINGDSKDDFLVTRSDSANYTLGGTQVFSQLIVQGINIWTGSEVKINYQDVNQDGKDELIILTSELDAVLTLEYSAATEAFNVI